MRTIFYYYNSHGVLFFDYSDGNGGHIDRSDMFYSFREALQKFRKEFGLEHKRIRLVDTCTARRQEYVGNTDENLGYARKT